MHPDSLSPGELERLREIGRYGMNQAACALSQLLGQPVEIRVPSVRLTRLEGVPEFLERPEEPVVAVILKLLGDARGELFLLLPSRSARSVLCRLLRQEAPPSLDEPIAASTLLEIGNILASAFLAALDNRLKMSLLPSIPELLVLPPDDLLHRLEGEPDYGDELFLLETAFVLPDAPQEGQLGHFCLRPAASSLPTLLEAARRAEGENRG